MHATACNRVNDPIVGHVTELSVYTGTIQIDRWIVASDTISWNDGRVVARNMPTMSDASKHCREITRRLKGTEQRAMSTMQTMVLGHEGRLESMRGWIEEIGTTSKKKWIEHFAHLKCMRLMERWLDVRIDSLLC